MESLVLRYITPPEAANLIEQNGITSCSAILKIMPRENGTPSSRCSIHTKSYESKNQKHSAETRKLHSS